MRWLVGLLVLARATPALADDPRDAFGFHKQPKPEPPLDCSDGLAFGCVSASDPLEPSAPYALTTWLPASYLLELPVANATHDAVAHYARGAGRDDAGPAFAGASGLENRWLVDGAPADSVRTGAADTRLPLAFLEGILVTAGGFAASDRASTGGVIDAHLRRGTAKHEIDARVWAGWTAGARHRAIVPATFYVRRGTVEAGPDASFSLVATGPLGEVLGGHAWYAAGIAPELGATDFTWKTSTVRDRDQDGMTDGLPGIVDTDSVRVDTRTETAYRAPLMLRTGLDRGVHHIELSLVGSTGNDTRYLFNSTLLAAGIDTTSYGGDAIATWRGRWRDTRAHAQLAWHRGVRRESAHDLGAADLPQLLTAYVPESLQEDPQLAATCDDNLLTDRYPMITNCPVPVGWFASGGAGELTDTIADRPSITADIAHRIGANVVRAGATGEDARLVLQSRFTGGHQTRSLFPGHTAERRFVDPDIACSEDPTLPCPTVDHSQITYRTRYTAAYVEDTWTAAPNMKVDGGMRWELMWVGTALHFSNELSPRLGASWDPLGGGRSRVWTSMGRSFALLPAGLGATVLRRERYVDQILSPFGEGRSLETGGPIVVTPGIQPLAQDELTFGGQVALARAVRATAWLQGRWLERGLETTVNGFDNPGALGGAPATRTTGLFTAELETAPTSRLALRAGYLYGHTSGSWVGPYDPREGAVLYAGSDFDASTTNITGRLASDLGHRTYIEAERRGRLGTAQVSVSTRLTVGSGRPRSALGDSDDGLIYLIPRGSAGRGPLLTQANVRIAARWRDMDITLDLFNVFDRRDPTGVDEVYSSGSIHPIDHGTAADLVFLKTDLATNATRRPGYDYATQFQSPLSAVLGIHRAL